MKIKFFAGLVSLLTLGALLTGCKQNASDSISADINTYSFTGEGGSKTVAVTASGKWTVAPSATWIEISEQTSEAFTVTVGKNEAGSLRNATINLTCGTATAEVVIYQEPADNGKWSFRMYDRLHGSVISPSGKYVGGYYTTVDQSTNTTVNYAVFINMETEERIELGPYAEDVMLLNGAWACTDDGKLFLSTSAESIMFDLQTKEYTKLAADGINGLPYMQQVAADNTTWVGWAQLTETLVPLLWQNGSVKQLPIPDRGYREEKTESVCARGIAANGSVIYGTVWDNMDYGMVYWDGDFSTCKWVGEDVYAAQEAGENKKDVNGVISWSNQYNISPDGKWIAGTYVKEFEDNLIPGAQVDVKYPAFYNTETKKTTVLTEFGDGSAMSAFGNIGMIGTPSFNTTTGYVIDLETGENLGTVTEWVLDKFGMIIPNCYCVYRPSEDALWGAILSVVGGGMVTVWNCYLGPAFTK